MSKPKSKRDKTGYLAFRAPLNLVAELKKDCRAQRRTKSFLLLEMLEQKYGFPAN